MNRSIHLHPGELTLFVTAKGHWSGSGQLSWGAGIWAHP